MRQDLIIENKTKEGEITSRDYVTSALWQIAYLRYKGYDITQIEKREGGETVAIFKDVDNSFLELIEDWHLFRSEAGAMNLFRKTFLDTKNILTLNTLTKNEHKD